MWLSPTLYCTVSSQFSKVFLIFQFCIKTEKMLILWWYLQLGLVSIWAILQYLCVLLANCPMSINTYYVHLKSITESAWSSNSWTISFCPWMHAYINAIISSIPLALWSTLSEWNVSFTASQQKCRVSKVVWCIEINGYVRKV